MFWLSQPVDALTAALNSPAGAPRFDAIVIGSGYGGAVAALRLAEQGLSVCVLERGREYVPGDYASNLSELPEHIRIDGAGRKTPGGDDDALLDIRQGEETTILLGNGLGGGSLINANVALAPDPRVFIDSGNPHYAWPRAIRDEAQAMQDAPDNPRAGLARYYERARRTLHATPFPGVRQADGSYVTPQKTRQFDAAFGPTRTPDLTVYFEAAGENPAGVKQSPCAGCGNCVTGCNFGAKGTLATSYLPRARRAGAQIYTGASAFGLELVEPQPGAATGAPQMWKVKFLPTRDLARRRLWNHDGAAPHAPAREVRLKGEQARAAAAQQAAALPAGDPPTYELIAPVVVLAAGSLGSTELLLHLQQAARHDEKPLPFAEKLGERFSGNGDQVSFGYWQTEPVHAVGWSTREEQKNGPVVGPTITRIAEIRGSAPRKSFLVQDAAIPGTLASVFQEIFALGSTLTQMTAWDFKQTGAQGQARDALGLSPEASEHTQSLLGIGHDEADGRIVLDAKSNRAVVSWKSLKPDDGAAHAVSPADEYLRRVDAAMSTAVQRLGAVYVSNPGWQPLPPGVQNLLSGPPLRGTLSIAHPLGGCVMAEDGAHGVVNERGRVFRGATGSSTYDGLYVLDGTIINGSLGANPFLTICALAERALELEAPHLAALTTRARRYNAAATAALGAAVAANAAAADAAAMPHVLVESAAGGAGAAAAGSNAGVFVGTIGTGGSTGTDGTFGTNAGPGHMPSAISARGASVATGPDPAAAAGAASARLDNTGAAAPPATGAWAQASPGAAPDSGSGAAVNMGASTPANAGPGTLANAGPGTLAHAGAAQPVAHSLPPQPAPDPYFAPRRASGIEFFEVLRRPLHDARGRAVNASLLVRFDSADMGAWYADPAHRFDRAAAQLRLELPPAAAAAGAPGSAHDRPTDWVTYDTEQPANVQVLAPGKNSGWRRVLRFPAVVFTWLILRGWDEIGTAIKGTIRSTCRGDSSPAGSPGVWSRLVSCVRQAWHATLTRVMIYEMDLSLRAEDAAAAQAAGFLPQLRMSGSKYISYAADWSALLAFFGSLLMFRPQRFLTRPNLWVSMTNLKVAFSDRTRKGAAPWLTGTLLIDACDMVQHLTPQIKSGDTSPGIIRLLGYPALFIRVLIQTRMWDFRLPDYGVLPAAHDDQHYDASDAVRRLIRPTHRLPRIDGRVPEFHPFTVTRARDGAPYTLGLWRYRAARGVQTAQVACTREGEAQGPPYVQCKSILLMHAFGQSALCFAEPSINHGMTRALLEEGWDVWLLESRISTALEGYDPQGTPDLRREPARRPASMDDIAAADVPAAVDHVIHALRGELGEPVRDLKIFAFAQCVGAASLAMATLSGQLSYEKQAPASGTQRRRSKLAGMVLSQFLPLVIGDPGTQARTILPVFLRDGVGLTGINFSTLDSVREAAAERARRGSPPADPDTIEMPGSDSMIDRVLATYPVPEEELRHDEGWGRGMTHAQATCRRIVGIEATLFAESRLADATHARMPILFGHANIELFNHASKCIEYERLVDVDGRNIYVTQDRILRHLHMPVGLLHGVDNRLFNVASSTRTAETLEGIFGATAGGVALMQIPGYGHLDPIIGENAKQDVYGHITRFFAGAWEANLKCAPVPGSLSVPPRAVPVRGAQATAGTQQALQSRVNFRDSIWDSADDALEAEYLP